MKKYVYYFLFFLVANVHATIINLVPLSGCENPSAFFNSHARDECMKALCDLKTAFSKLGFELKVTTNEQACSTHEITFFFDVLPSFLSKHDTPRKWLLFLWEPPTVQSFTYRKDLHHPFDQVFTMFDDLVDGKKYVKFYYPQPRLQMIEDLVPFEEKKLCTLIACNKKSNHPNELYSHRMSAIRYFEQNAPSDFDLYGVGWSPLYFRSYKGLIDHKVPFLKQYKFSICYENMHNSSGYITEKIFDSFVAGCVPVYWGAKNIADYIPDCCYISREKFATTDQLHDYLKNMPEDTYNTYLKNIRDFFESDEVLLFSIEYFIDTVLQAVISDYDKTLVFSNKQIEKIERAKKINQTKNSH